MLFSLVLFPLFSAILILALPFTDSFCKKIGLASSLLTFLFSLFLWVFFDNQAFTFQYVQQFAWFDSMNIFISFGLDGISLFFVLLTTFLIPICILSLWDLPAFSFLPGHIKRFFVASFLIIESFILIVFTVLDIFAFYTFFEAVLIPIFFIIGVWGSRERKVRASFLFFLYTLIGSLFILLAIFVIYLEVGTTDYIFLIENSFSFEKQKLLWLAFFLSFAVKVPIVPFHIWLPEAHVEAPTAGSVLLAGVLLKLGSYGFIRYSVGLLPFATFYFRPFIFIVCITGIIYTSITAIRQTDIKRVIAYASVAHINITLLGLFSLNLTGVEGAIFQILSHGVVSGALFLCVGVLYDRHHTRLIKCYSGLAHTIPIFIFFFFIFTMANIGFPGTSSFVGEFLILVGLFCSNTVVGIFAATSLILGGFYSLWLFNRIAYGNFKTELFNFSSDINRREFAQLAPLCFLSIFIGIYPEIILQPMHVSCIKLAIKITI